jgi:hypothetical protein
MAPVDRAWLIPLCLHAYIFVVAASLQDATLSLSSTYPQYARVPACGWGSSLSPGVPGRRLGGPREYKVVLVSPTGRKPLAFRRRL